MNRILVLSVVFLSGFGCVTDEPVEQVETLDLCEQAAEHRAACTGDYVTPPECDAFAELAAQEILEVPCENFETEFKSNGKADGALCDWFGTGCTPDEPIFGGPACDSDAQCGEGLCVEARCFDGIVSEEFQGVMDLFTDTQEYEGGQTRLLANNEETRQLRRAMVAGAQSSVHFSAFIIQDDEVGWEMVEDFSEAAGRGVEVRVLIDATTQYFANYALITEMAAAGVQVIAYNPITEWALLRPLLSITANDRLHEKILVVDGQAAIVGGRNVGNEYLNDGRWRDIDVLVEGAAVEGIQRMFLGIWDKAAGLEFRVNCSGRDKYGFHCPQFEGEEIVNDMRYYSPVAPSGDLKARPVYSDPLVQETPHGYFTTLALVRGARESIEISAAYFVPPRRLRKHLKAAVERGVRVQVVTNSKVSTDGIWMYYASLNYYKELIQAGIEIYEFNGTELLHSKAMVVDGDLAVIGSFNIDPRSAIDNSESMLLIREDDVVSELAQALAEDVQNATRASADIPFGEMLKAKSHRLIEPLL